MSLETDVVTIPAPAAETPAPAPAPAPSAADTMHVPSQPTASRVAETLDHVPALAPRARGAAKGGAFSDAIAAFKALPAGAKGIAVAVDPGKVAKLGGMPKVQAALRTAFKRSGGIAGSSFSVSPTADGRIWVGKL